MNYELPTPIAGEANHKWQVFTDSVSSAGLKVPTEPAFIRQATWVFALSDFVCDSAKRYPDMIIHLIETNAFNRPYDPEKHNGEVEKELAKARDDVQLGTILRKHRLREMVRIAWRDLAGLANLDETTADLSSLAEICIRQAFSYLHTSLCHTLGTPVNAANTTQMIVVIAMGKLGARELNFSSDIDLIFSYPESGYTINGPHAISNDEFFTSLCRKFLSVFSETTGEGLLFRVDMRLRPFGENGPIVMNFNALENYYLDQGREWERYALIKARMVSIGDPLPGNQLAQRLKPFIYRRYLDYGVYDALREMKRKIAQEVARKGLENNIKLGAGGIREIEFFGQIFQLIRGGVEPTLQDPSIVNVLSILSDNNYIPADVKQELTDAYIFFRNTEHRLQAFYDQQTHDLPASWEDKLRLALGMGFKDWDDYLSQLSHHRQTVHGHFNELLSTADDSDHADSLENELSALWNQDLESEQAEKTLLNCGFKTAPNIIALLDFLRNATETRALSRDGRDRLNKLMPIILKMTGRSRHPEQTFTRITDLIKAIERRTCYLALLLEHPEVITHLIRLSEASPWIIKYLSQYPVLLDELLDARHLYTAPEKNQLEEKLWTRLNRVHPDDLEAQIEEMSIFKQINTLHVAAADVTGAFPLMKVSDYLSYIAETILKMVLDIAWDDMVAKHGTPVCHTATICDKGFAVIAYGKLGGLELGYGSDLDLVFVHAGAHEPTVNGKQPIESGYFYSRLGQRIIHLLTSHTRAGKIYDIDMRLRPSGSSGPLVSNISAFKEYQEKDAWTWEHQALVRSRAICGDTNLMRHFEAIRKHILSTPRDSAKLQTDIRSMRDRLRNEHDPTPKEFHLKQGQGGIIDIEFLVQYLVLLHAHQYRELTIWSDNIRQLEALAKTAILQEADASFLKHAYLTLREEVHRRNLQQIPTVVDKSSFKNIRKRVRHIWAKYL